MDSRDVESYFGSHKNILAVFLIIIGMVSISGFFMGMRQSMNEEDYPSPWLDGEDQVEGNPLGYPEAPLYKEIPETKWKANRDWKNELANLPRQKMELTARKPLTPSELMKILQGRSDRRAFDGAPPTIPHAINYRDVLSCTACHSQDANTIVAGNRVPAMSHHYLSNCTQCHVPSEVVPTSKGLVVENNFVGNPRPGKGTRAYQGAPPTTPHRLWMRQNCMSCHGPEMPDAIVTPHPQRSNCLQCHALDASYDNREQVPPLIPGGND